MSQGNLTQQPVSLLQEIIVTGIPLVTIAVNVPAIVMLLWILVRKEKASNIHLLSIGITDMFVGVTAYLMAETYVQREKKFQNFDCTIRFYLFSVMFVASMLHVLGICIQRILIVLRKETEEQHRQSQKYVEWIVIGLSWTLSIVFNVIPFSIWVNNDEIEFCSFDSVHAGNERQTNTYLGTLYIIVIVMVLSSMGTLFRLVHIRIPRDTPVTQGSHGAVAMRMICVTVCIMAAIFVVTTLPLAIVLLNHESLNASKRLVRAVVVLISLINSVINPFVYLFRIKEHRKILRKIVCCSTQNVCCKVTSVNIIVVSEIHTQTSRV